MTSSKVSKSKNEQDSKICQAPIIFLDTSILIEASKGEPIYKDLLDLVITLTRERKIISIEGAQRDEIRHGKDTHGIEILKECCHATSSLEFIQKKQIFRATCDYIKNNSEGFTLQIGDIFLHDPSIAGTSGLRRITDSEALGINTDKKILEQAELHEIIRQANIASNISYQEGRNVGFRILTDVWKSEPYLYGAWKSDADRFNNFWDSKFFTEIPYVYLFSSLYALIVTNKTRKIFDETTKKPIKGRKGDWIDLLSISTLLPYCDYFIADKNMKDMLKQIAEQDKNDKYFNKIYSSSAEDIEKLIQTLKTINK